MSEAWVTGDFEYLADRLFKKAHEKLRDEQAALEAARGASYALHTRWSDGGAVRTSALIRDGNEIGWVAQFDQARVDLSYVSVDGAGTHAGALAGDRQLLLATSGSYVTADQRTAGLSVVDGPPTTPNTPPWSRGWGRSMTCSRVMPAPMPSTTAGTARRAKAP